MEDKMNALLEGFRETCPPGDSSVSDGGWLGIVITWRAPDVAEGAESGVQRFLMNRMTIDEVREQGRILGTETARTHANAMAHR